MTVTVRNTCTRQQELSCERLRKDSGELTEGRRRRPSVVHWPLMPSRAPKGATLMSERGHEFTESEYSPALRRFPRLRGGYFCSRLFERGAFGLFASP
jgi:hypothetical protein